MCMCVYACLCMWWYRVTCTQIGTSRGQRLVSGVVPQVLSVLFLKIQFLAQNWNLSIMSVWLARETLEFFWLHPPTSMFTGTCHHAWLFTWILGLELRQCVSMAHLLSSNPHLWLIFLLFFLKHFHLSLGHLKP